MRKIMHKVKSQWVVIGVAAVIMIGMAGVALGNEKGDNRNAEIRQSLEKHASGDDNKASKEKKVENTQQKVGTENLRTTQEGPTILNEDGQDTTLATDVIIQETVDETIINGIPNEISEKEVPMTEETNVSEEFVVETESKSFQASVEDSPTGEDIGSVEKVPELGETVDEGGDETLEDTETVDVKTEESNDKNQELIETMETKTVKETSAVTFDVVYVEDASMNVGEEKVIQTGVTGITEKTYTEVLCDGVRESYTLTNTAVISEPVDQIVKIGVKEVKQETKIVSIPYETVYQYNASIKEGNIEVVQAGSTGETLETYTITYVKGLKVAEELINTEVIKEPVKQILVQGTKYVPELITEEQTKDEVIPYTSKKVYDPELDEGVTQVITAGVKGQKTVIEKVVYTDGIETNREVISEKITQEPIQEVVVVGTKRVPVVTAMEESKQEEVPYTSITMESPDLEEGQTEVRTPGVNGEKTIIEKVTYMDGTEIGREIISGKITKEPIQEVIIVGKKRILFPEIMVDVTPFSYDNLSNLYYLDNTLDSIAGSITNIDNVQKLSYQVLDVNKNVLLKNNIKIQSNWIIEEIGFVLGLNTLEIIADTFDAASVYEKINILNLNEKNMKLINIDEADNDNDGLINYLEGIHGTNPNLTDTDSDMLNDYYEITVTLSNPNAYDSDGDGISDGEEDNDGDGVSNSKEALMGSDPDFYDTDFDGLSDKIELEIGTSVTDEDTDGDGLLDYDELKYELNPLQVDTDGDGVVDGEDIVETTLTTEDMPYYDIAVIPEITIQATGVQIPSLEIKPVEDDAFLSSKMPGYIGSAYEFTIDGKFESAKLSFSFDSLLLKNPEFDPAIYYYDEASQLLEELDNQTRAGNNITVNLEHFSKYMLLDRYEVNKIWNDEIKDSSIETGYTGSDIVLVIDSSYSMRDNDPDFIRLEIAKKLIDNLGPNDRAAIVELYQYSTEKVKFTNNKDTLMNALNEMKHWKSGTNITGSLDQAIKVFTFDELILKNNSDNRRNIIVITDGDTDGVGVLGEETIISKAIQNQITIYTIGLGENVASNALINIAEGTGGEYYFALYADELYSTFNKTKTDMESLIDSDNDGLSDYAERHIRLGNGIVIETDPYNPDSDEDGLLDGEEVFEGQTKDGKIYYKLKSNPTERYSDGDQYNDFIETKKLGTDPLKDTAIMDSADTDYLLSTIIDSEDKEPTHVYEEFYKEWLTLGGIKQGAIGYQLAGLSYTPSKLLYKEILFEFMQGLNEAENSNNSSNKTLSDIKQFIDSSSEPLNNILKIAGDDKVVQQDILRLLKFYDVNYDYLSEEGKLMTDEKIRKEFIQLINDVTNAEVDGSYIGELIWSGKDFFDLENTLSLSFRNNFLEEIGGSKFSLVIDGMSFFTESHKMINAFEASYQALCDNKTILKTIVHHAEDKELKQAAQELYNLIDDQIAFENDNFKKNIYADQLIKTGSLISASLISSAISAIPIYGPIVAAGDALLEAVLHLTERGQNRFQLYALSDSTRGLKQDFDEQLSKVKSIDGQKYEVCIEDGNIPLFFYQLSQALIKSENFYKDHYETMWLSKGDIQEKSDAISNNVEKLNAIDDKYLLAPINKGNTEKVELTIEGKPTDSNVIAYPQTVQMRAKLDPFSLSKTVTWAVECGTGMATIDSRTGLLTVEMPGIITVKAKVNDEAGVVGEITLTILEPLTITSYSGETEKDVEIPTIIDGALLKNGYYEGFQITGNITGNIGANEKGLVTCIGNNAFEWYGLTEVTIPENVKIIGDFAFRHNNLSKVVIPSGVKIIGSGVFGYNELTEVIIPDTVESIDNGAFGANKKLQSIIIPTGVKNIGPGAFYGSGLTTVSIPGSVNTISERVFCRNELTEVTISEGVKIIEEAAFGANHITKIEIPSSVIRIKNHAFGDNKITDLTIPSYVTIDESAFEHNPINRITIGKGVSVGKYMLGSDNKFRDAYYLDGSGVYEKMPNNEWRKID